MMSTRAADNLAIVAYVNLVGGQDEIVFDGSSLLLDQYGEVLDYPVEVFSVSDRLAGNPSLAELRPDWRGAQFLDQRDAFLQVEARLSSAFSRRHRRSSGRRRHRPTWPSRRWRNASRRCRTR